MKNPEGRKNYLEIFWIYGGTSEVCHDESNDLRCNGKTEKSWYSTGINRSNE